MTDLSSDRQFLDALSLRQLMANHESKLRRSFQHSSAKCLRSARQAVADSPQREQNLLPAAIEFPHLLHSSVFSDFPQSWQKRASALLLASQLAQRTVVEIAP